MRDLLILPFKVIIPKLHVSSVHTAVVSLETSVVTGGNAKNVSIIPEFHMK